MTSVAWVYPLQINFITQKMQFIVQLHHQPKEFKHPTMISNPL